MLTNVFNKLNYHNAEMLKCKIFSEIPHKNRTTSELLPHLLR